ncbi:MAG: class II aldolase/adducin family protein [Candidatus Korarchaeota archaeon]|nr:class II aldolase/adducin family protein [Candidatus Korarchaeota archaeon]
MKRYIVEVCRELVKKKLTHGSSGNMSVFLRDKGLVFITPSGIRYIDMLPEQIAVLTLEGKQVEGDYKPTIETPMHLTIYRNRPDVNAIVHTHPVYTSALAIAREPLPPVTEEFIIYVGGTVDVAKFGGAGTQELADNVLEALKDKKAAIMPNHGLITVGKDLKEACFINEVVEIHAQMYLMAKIFGKAFSIPEDAISRWKKVYYQRTRIKEY